MNTSNKQTATQTHPHAPPLSFPIALAALVLGAFAMGVSPVFVRTAEVGPFASAFWRVMLALPLLGLWCWWEQGRDKEGGPGSLVAFTTPAVLSGVFFAGDLFFWHLSIVKTTMANATLMACLAPVWVILFSGLLIGERVRKNSYLGLIICLAGAAFLMGSSYQIAPERLMGDFYGLITSIFFGLYFLSMRVGRRNLPSGKLIFSSTIVTTIILFVIAVFSGDDFIPKSSSGVASLLSLGILSHAGGQGLMAIAIGSLSAVFSSLVIFMEVLAAALFGWLVFSEPLGIGQWFGGAMILAGIWIGRPKE